jgi:hypothetical protein
MEYPIAIKYEDLETKHADYVNHAEVRSHLNLLIAGGKELANQAEWFIPQLQKEPPEIYEQRLKHFAYTPILSMCLNELLDKLSDVEQNISGVPSSWKMDGETESIQQFLEHSLRGVLIDGICFVQVEHNMTIDPVNKLQQERAGLRKVARRLKVEEVYDYDFEKNSNRLKYIKIRQIQETKDWLSSSLELVYTIINSSEIIVYKRPIRIKDGQIQIFIQDEDWRKIKNDDMIPLVEGYPEQHDYKQCPIIAIQFRNEDWLGNQVYLKVLQHTRIENGLTCTLTTNSFIQKTIKPFVVPNDDSHSYTDVEDKVKETILNNHTRLVAEEFKFVEIAGTSIGIAREQLDKIEGQTRDIFGLPLEDVAVAVNQSGMSKGMSRVDTVKAVKSYLCPLGIFLQSVLLLMTGKNITVELNVPQPKQAPDPETETNVAPIKSKPRSIAS